MQPLVMVMPALGLVTCLFAIGAIVAVFDADNAHNPARCVLPVRDRLLEASASSTASALGKRSSMRRSVTTFCVRYLRGLIETCSSYVIMPCTFVFVLNLRPASFDQADSSQRAMIVALPVMTLLLRALVIRQRVVQLTSADQKQLVAGSFCSCVIVAVLSCYFERVHDEHQSSSSFATLIAPQYIVLALLIIQVIVQTAIRLRATEESFLDNAGWPWSSARAQSSSDVFPFDELATRLVMGYIKSASFTAAIAAAKFFLLNHLPLSQIAMVVAGLASSGAVSPSSIEASSVIIGGIPLVSSGVLLLHNIVKFVAFLRQKWCGLPKQADVRHSDRDSFY